SIYSSRLLLTLGLAVSLSGCAGFGTWNNNWNNSWNNITGGVRNYGQYPMPNAQTCFTNPTLVAAKQQGLDNLEFQKAAEGISKITLVRDELIPATNQLFVNNNPQPLNALYAQIQPPTLANFMIGCNEVIVKERAQLIQERQHLLQERVQLIQDINTKRNQIAQWQNYLNTTPAPQPTLQTFQESYVTAHQEIGKAEDAIGNIYQGKPMLLFLVLCLYTPVDQINTFLNINTIQGLQNFQQQLQKEHLLTDGTIPPINWAKYKLTFSGVMTMTETTAQTIQGLQKIHQQLQGIHQQLQGIHQAFYGSHPHTMLRESQATMASPSADIKFWESLPYHGTPGSLGIINWDKALIAVQHGNYMPLIAIYSQMQPQTWRNYFVNLYKWGQKMHIKAKINTIY
ncbi:MAG: hypothetical protein J6P19_08825, partial [Acetobacter sp.]|nr:hypothetical protein [Acetobacter sp.]